MGETNSSKIRDLDNKIDSLSNVRDALESEISLLEERIEQQRESLKAKSDVQSGKEGGIYVFDEEDRTAVAFDEFFSKTDPEVDKIRDDLLNDSPPRHRFSVLSARLGG